eukprot:scaffold15705_cov34-Isochrysis_galbana.AAC.1
MSVHCAATARGEYINIMGQKKRQNTVAASARCAATPAPDSQLKKRAEEKKTRHWGLAPPCRSIAPRQQGAHL